MFLRDALLTYEQSAPDLGGQTRCKLRYLVASWERRTKNPTVSKIDPTVFAEFRRRCLRDSLSPHSIETSITDVLTILKSVGVHVDPGRRLKRPDPDPQSPTLADMGKWYVACASPVSPHLDWCSAESYMRAFYCVAYWTGFRLADLFALTYEDITADGIRRRANKTGKVHTIPMSPVVDRHIRQLGTTKGPLFPAGRTCPTHLRHWMHSIADAAGVPRFGPQNLRIAAVNAWRDAGGSESAQIIHGEGLGGRGAIRWYLSRSTPAKILALSAPKFIWPSEVLLPEERDRREAETQDLVNIVRRLQPARLADVRRVALAFADCS